MTRAKPRLHIVVTAGPTREFFDSVRFISTPAAGEMGYAVAAAAAASGHRVTLVSGPVEIAPPPKVKLLRVTTAAEMAKATKAAFANADAAVLTAAVCDYRPQRRAARKQAKKTRSKAITLVPTEDIAASLGRRKGRRVTITFALEDHNARAHAERKMERKNSDAIVLNGPENVGSDRAKVEFLCRDGDWQTWRAGSKAGVARRIVRELERLSRATGG